MTLYRQWLEYCANGTKMPFEVFKQLRGIK